MLAIAHGSFHTGTRLQVVRLSSPNLPRSAGLSVLTDPSTIFYMCVCSPVCKSFFDTLRAAGSFIYVSGLDMRRILFAGRYDVLRSGSSSLKKTRFGPVQKYGCPEADQAIGCSISGPELPAIRLGRDALGEFSSRQRIRRGPPAFPGFQSSF